VQEKKRARGRTLITVLVCAGFCFLALLIWQPTEVRKISRLALDPQSNTSTTGSDAGETMNIAVLGVGGADHAGGSLTDTIMLASINLRDGRAVLFSIPRDLYWQRADGSGQRLNAALASLNSQAADAAQIKAVFKDGFSVHVDHFVRMDFQAFVQVIDAVGGVEVEFTEPLHDAHFEAEYRILDYQPGVHLLDGRAALYVSRSRMTSDRGDIDRAARQRAILTAFSKRLSNLEGLATPGVLKQLAEAQRQHVQTDLGILDLIRLYQLGKSMSANDISTIGIEDSPEPLLDYATIAGAAVLVPRDNNMAAITQFLHRSIGTPDSPG